jgi:hypothetical protein
VVAKKQQASKNAIVIKENRRSKPYHNTWKRLRRLGKAGLLSRLGTLRPNNCNCATVADISRHCIRFCVAAETN